MAVVVTNMVMSDPGGGAMFVSDPKKPLGGHVVAHATTTRLSLRKGKAEQRLAKIVQCDVLADCRGRHLKPFGTLHPGSGNAGRLRRHLNVVMPDVHA